MPHTAYFIDKLLAYSSGLVEDEMVRSVAYFAHIIVKSCGFVTARHTRRTFSCAIKPPSIIESICLEHSINPFHCLLMTYVFYLKMTYNGVSLPTHST